MAPEGWVDDVLGFWFEELTPEAWFRKDAATDSAIRDRFLGLYASLSRRQPLAATARGALAAVIVLDQLPRNMFRDSGRAFATDAIALALALAEEAIAKGLDRGLTAAERQFLYLPFQHAEDASVQARSVEIFARLDDAEMLDYAERHKAIIDRLPSSQRGARPRLDGGGARFPSPT